MSSRTFDTVESLKKRYNTSEPRELAEECGIIVKEMDIGKCLGFYTEMRRVRYIVLSETLEESIYRFVLSHELGHGILHRDLAKMKKIAPFSFFDLKTKPEFEANMFAANLLISDRDILECAEDGYTVGQTASILRIMPDIVVLKMMDMRNRGYAFTIPYIPNGNIFNH